MEILEVWRNDESCFLRLGLEEGEGWYIVYESPKDWQSRYFAGRFFPFAD